MGYVVGAQSFGVLLLHALDRHPRRRSGSTGVSAYVFPAVTVALAAARSGAAPRRGASWLQPPARGADDHQLQARQRCCAIRSARRWTTRAGRLRGLDAELTYIGAFYIESYGHGETTVGLLLADRVPLFLVTSTNTSRLTALYPRRPLIALAALGMGVILVPLLNWTPPVGITVALVCTTAFFAAVRSAGSSSLGLVQLRENREHDGRAHGERPARLCARSGRRRARDRAAGVRRARVRAVRRHGGVRRIDPPCGRPRGRRRRLLRAAIPSRYPTEARIAISSPAWAREFARW